MFGLNPLFCSLVFPSKCNQNIITPVPLHCILLLLVSLLLLLLGVQVASAVIELQGMLPNARVLYCSATGVSEVSMG